MGNSKPLTFFTPVFLGCLLVSGLFQSCKKGTPHADKFPETYLSIEAINLSGENRLNSTVTLSWYGTDSDGYIDGFEISLDNQNWGFTSVQDSTFSFDIPAGQDTADIDFYVRAIDDDGNTDPTPAYLSVPLKNTAPIASFNDDAGPADTALLAATFPWSATDPDGDESLTKVEVRFNDGPWYAINLEQDLISFLLTTTNQSGPGTADLYYGTDDAPAITDIEGVEINAVNHVQIRATDQAGTTSAIDTADSFYFKNKTPGAEILWVSGQSASITNEYSSYLNTINAPYDLLAYGLDITGAHLPSYWDPTFKLITTRYDIIFANTGQEDFTNKVTGTTKTMLEFMAPVMQKFHNDGGKSFITTSFSKEKDLSELSGPYPVESLVVPAQGQARIQSPDSALIPVFPGNFPALGTSSVRSGIVPIVGTGDSDDFYRAELLKLQGWTGTDIIAVIRRPNGVLSQVFFALQLHDYDNDPAKLEQLLEEILINEF